MTDPIWTTCPLCHETGEVCWLDVFERCTLCRAYRTHDNWQRYETMYEQHVVPCILCHGVGHLNAATR